MGVLGDLVKQAGGALARGGKTRPRPYPPPPIPLPRPDSVPGPAPAPPGTQPAPETQAPAEGVGETPAVGDKSTMGEATRLENRVRRRNKNCCRPFEFLHAWLIKGNPLANKLDQSINFTDSDFRSTSGEQVAFKRGVTYQYYVTGAWEYLARSASGASLWADGERSARCWLQEAKYQMPLRNTSSAEAPYTPSPETSARIQKQFENYGKVCNNPAPIAKPCWNIGLEVYVSRRGGPVRYYHGLLVQNGIEGVTIWRPIPQEAVAEIDDAFNGLDPKKKK
jgi:hypothetical protein